MGYYINPKPVTLATEQKSSALAQPIPKEFWLAQHAACTLSSAPDWVKLRQVARDMLPVCLVDNGVFSAASICYSEEELAAFAQPDGRRKAWFLVPIKDLLEVCPEIEVELRLSGIWPSNSSSAMG